MTARIRTYQDPEGGWTVAYNHVWVHGIFADERTARYACRYSDAELHALDHIWEFDKGNRPATFEEVRELRKRQKSPAQSGD